MQLKIREKSIVLFALCALAPLFVVSIGSYFYARDALSEFVEVELSLVTREALDGLDRQFSEGLVDLKSWSQLRVMQDVLIDDEENEISDELIKLRQQYLFYADLLVINQNGMVIAATQVENKGRDLSGTDLFAATRSGQIFEGRATFSKDPSNVPMVFALPVVASYDRSTVIGTLIGVIDWERVRDSLAAVSMAGARQDGSHILILTAGVDHRILYETPAITETQKSTTIIAHSYGDGLMEITADSTNYAVVGAASYGAEVLSVPRWELHAAVSTDVAFASVIRLRTQALIVGTLASLLAVGIGWLGANSLVRPIGALIATMKALAKGKDEIDIPSLDRKDEIGSMAQALEVFKNVAAKLKRNEAQLTLARDEAESANRAKSEFLATMSHELRTPLNAIIGFSDVIKQELLGPVGSVKYRDYAHDINESGQHLLDLINSVLDLSKVESGVDDIHEENIKVSEILRAVKVLVKERAHRASIELRFECPDNLPALRVDGRKLKQILANLLSNAIKFTPVGGKVMLKSWSGVESGHVFQITDTGIGIAAEDLPKVLTPFRQIDSKLSRQYEGTGLGLPLAKAFAEMHGGSLDLQSTVGVGTTATVRFPPERIVLESCSPSPLDTIVMKAG